MTLPLLGYLDPGSGSLLAQVILGGAAAFLVAVRLGWHYVWSRLAGLFKRG